LSSVSHSRRRSAAAALLLAALALALPASAAEAPAVDVRFTGNAHQSDGALRRAAAVELARYGSGGRRPADIDDAAFRMEQAYRREGYAFARVDYEIAPPDGAAVVFRVDEGPRVLVDRVSVDGNEALERDTILELLRGECAGPICGERFPFVRARVESGVAALRDAYAERGYLNAVVDEPAYEFRDGDSRVGITLVIREGPAYRVRRLTVAGDPPPESREAIDRLVQETLDHPFTPRLGLVLRSQAVEIMGDRGYPDARATVRVATPDGPGPVDLTLTVERGPLVVVDAVRVEGARHTREGFILEHLKLRPGERYDLALERQSTAALFKSGLFRRLEIGLEPTADPGRRVVVVTVEEADRQEVYVEPGYGSYEGLRVRTGYRRRNLLGTALSWNTEAAGSLKYQGAASTLSDPFFLGADLKADLTGFAQRREEPAFTRRDLGGSVFVTRELGRSLTVSAGYTLRSTDLSDLGAAAEAEDSQQDYDLSSVKVQLTYDTRDDLLYPSSGQRTFGAAEQADSWLGGDVNFTRLTAGSRWFFPLPGAIVLGLRYDTGFIVPGRGNINVPPAERFFNGGENTVRSFKEDRLGPRDASGKPAGGLGFNVLTVELRRRLIENLSGSLFADLGNVAPNRTRGEDSEGSYRDRNQLISDTLGDFFRNFRPGLGFGLQYRLPIGPVRLDVAFNPDRDDQRDEDLCVVHFSIGMAF
jgi:outer membrane protein assembly complex protein YaeT